MQAEIPPEWEGGTGEAGGGGAGRNGTISVPKSYNELATLMSVTGARPCAGRRQREAARGTKQSRRPPG